MAKEKVLLAYSGGLDTSVILKWLTLKGYEVVAYVANVGQESDWDTIKEKAHKSGACEVIIDDLREEFVKDFVFPAVAFNALYEGRYYLGTSLARPVIVKGMVEAARKTGCSYFAHGATGKGNDQVRFELTAAALAPDLKVIAPWRDEEFYTVIKGRKEAMEFAAKYDIPVKATVAKPWSSDDNALHISFEAGILEDPAVCPPDDMFEYSKSPKVAPDKATVIELEFDKGVAVKLNGETLSPYNMLMALNKLGGENGIGRVDMVESRYVGMKSRGVYETPGAAIIMAAHRDLEGLTLDGSVLNLKETLMPRFATLVYNGFWFSHEMDCMRALLDKSQEYVTGKVKVELYKGNVTVIGRESANDSLFNAAYSTFEEDSVYDQKDANGFIKLNALRFIIGGKAGRKY